MKIENLFDTFFCTKVVQFEYLNSCRHGVVGDSPFQEAEEFKNQSIVYVGIDGILAGVIYVEDQIREDARHVIESLTQQGINTYLLSGDKRSAAEYVASAVGIPKNRVRHLHNTYFQFWLEWLISSEFSKFYQILESYKVNIKFHQ